MSLDDFIEILDEFKSAYYSSRSTFAEVFFTEI